MRQFRLCGDDPALDWCEHVGRTKYQVPAAMPVEADGDVTLVSTLVATFGDPAVDPRSGGIIGQTAIAGACLMTTRHARRTILREPWIQWIGNLPATNIVSLAAWDAQHAEKTKAAHLAALGITQCSSGSSF